MIARPLSRHERGAGPVEGLHQRAAEFRDPRSRGTWDVAVNCRCQSAMVLHVPKIDRRLRPGDGDAGNRLPNQFLLLGVSPPKIISRKFKPTLVFGSSVSFAPTKCPCNPAPAPLNRVAKPFGRRRL